MRKKAQVTYFRQRPPPFLWGFVVGVGAAVAIQTVVFRLEPKSNASRSPSNIGSLMQEQDSMPEALVRKMVL